MNKRVFEINTYAAYIQIKLIQLILPYTPICLANSTPIKVGFHPAVPFMHQMPLFC